MRNSNRLFAVAWLFAASVAASFAYALPIPASVSEPNAQLIVVYQDTGIDLPLSPEEIVAAVNNPFPGARDDLIVGRLRLPTRARFMIKDRISNDDLALYGPDHPRAALQRYIVLDYSKATVAEGAMQALKADRNILWVGVNRAIKLLATGPDPLIRPGEGPLTNQWGLEALNLFKAWVTTPGHAYVGIVDGGIELGHPDLENFRPQFSRNYGVGSSVDDGDYGYENGIQRKYPTTNGTTPAKANLVGHGTHVAGIIAATRNNAAGGSGVCPKCSLMIAKANRWNSYPSPDYPAGSGEPRIETAQAVEALAFLIRSGAQVVNMSFGITPADAGVVDCDTARVTGPNGQITYPPNAPWCPVLDMAAYYQVLLVAAAGNCTGRTADYPASDPQNRVWGIGGVQLKRTPPQGQNGVESAVSAGMERWDENKIGECETSNVGSAKLATNADPPPSEPQNPAAREWKYPFPTGVVAPARHIWSTFHTGFDWAPSFECGDSYPNPTNPTFPGYGWCTGTSMAAPHISGLAGIIRSMDPLMTPKQVRNLIAMNSSLIAAGLSPTQALGAGVPDARAAVCNVFDSHSALTPLFSLRRMKNATEEAGDYFYTTVPQMAGAALNGDLLPFINAAENKYLPVGRTLIGINNYPGSLNAGLRAVAQAFVFTTPVNPSDQANPLLPLYRLSYADATRVDHVYVNSTDHFSAFPGYQLDGIEGYVYPPTSTQPATGTEKLYRMCRPPGHALVLDSDRSSLPSGWNICPEITSHVGWAHRNDGSYSDPPLAAFVTCPSAGSSLSSTTKFQWAPGNGVTNYMLNVGTTVNGGQIFNGSMTTNSQTVSGFPTDGSTIYVRLSSLVNGTWQWRDYTYRGTVPPIPTTYTPTGAWSTNAPTYTWSYVPEALKYRLYVEGYGFWDLNWTQAHCNGSTCWYTPPDALPYSTTINWYVNAANYAGVSDFSPARTFTTPAAPVTPGQPVPISPFGAGVVGTPTFTWQAGARTTTYGMVVRDTATYDMENVALTPAQAGCPGNVGNCSFTASFAFPPGAGYTWGVIAVNDSGSVWSNWMNFVTAAPTVAPGYPAQWKPSGYWESTRPTFQWYAGSDTTTYQLLVQDWFGNQVINVTLTPGQAGCKTNTGLCSYVPGIYLQGGYTWYTWYIAAINSVGTTFGSGASFRTYP